MVAFINDHRDQYGVEPICTVLPIAPSTYFRHERCHVDPTRRSARAQRDDTLRSQIQRVWDEQFQVYGPRKVWRQLRREGVQVARCTVRRLMRAMGLAGAVRGRAWTITTQASEGYEATIDPGGAILNGSGMPIGSWGNVNFSVDVNGSTGAVNDDPPDTWDNRPILPTDSDGGAGDGGGGAVSLAAALVPSAGEGSLAAAAEVAADVTLPEVAISVAALALIAHQLQAPAQRIITHTVAALSQQLQSLIHQAQGFIGNNPRPSSGQTWNTDLPGGDQAAEEMFDRMTNGESETKPDGKRVGRSGVQLRRGSDGRLRIDVPGDRPESIHFHD